RESESQLIRPCFAKELGKRYGRNIKRFRQDNQRRSEQLTRLFDPHIHMYSRTTDDYDAMSKAGIEVIVQPSFWLGSPRTSVGTFVDYWEHMLTFETKRAKEFGIEHFVCVSVNPKESNERPLALNVLQAMDKYIE